MVKNPQISICLPNLNMRRYLPERLDSIESQTFGDWELLAYDSLSDDGSWELLKEAASVDPRIRAWQGPQEGIYPAWNICIKQARGEFIYMATSDDTMANDCLEKMLAALRANPSCGIAHCPLRVINACGKELGDRWWFDSVFARSFPEMVRKPHIRPAPLDGLLHLVGKSVYHSATQLLVRRIVYDTTGFYDTRWGSRGDFHWNMRAALKYDTVHVPTTWASWRCHPMQATAASDTITAHEISCLTQCMIEDALTRSPDKLSGQFKAELLSHWGDYQLRLCEHATKLASAGAPISKALNLFIECLSGSQVARDDLWARIVRGRSHRFDLTEAISCWLQSKGLKVKDAFP